MSGALFCMVLVGGRLNIGINGGVCVVFFCMLLGFQVIRFTVVGCQPTLVCCSSLSRVCSFVLGLLWLFILVVGVLIVVSFFFDDPNGVSLVLWLWDCAPSP